MNYYKVAGALLLAACGILMTLVLNRRADRALSQLDGWIALLRYVRAQVDCFSLPMAEILSRGDEALLRSCGYEGGAPPRSFDDLLSACPIRDEETRRILWGFADAFGRGYREEQLKRCDYDCALLCGRREALAAKLPERKRLNATLCVCGVLMLALLLL